jgi:hypothetical protein
MSASELSTESGEAYVTELFDRYDTAADFVMDVKATEEQIEGFSRVDFVEGAVAEFKRQLSGIFEMVNKLKEEETADA